MYCGVMRRLALVLGLGALACSTLVAAAGADPHAARVLDRTYSCVSGYLGGIYQVHLELYGKRQDPAVGDGLAFGEVTTTLFPNPRLAGLGPSWLDINPTHCSVLRTRAPIATLGLRGGRVGALGQIVNCETPKRVIVRIRGAFDRPVALRRMRIFDLTLLHAEAPARLTTVALSTPKGKPIAVASIEAGKASLFTSGNCEED
jgi:hypothetical protein